MFFRYKNLDLGLLLVRLTLALIFFFAAWGKISNIPKAAGFFASLGFDLWVLYFIVAVELLAGTFFLLGIFPAYGYVIAIQMAVILIKIKIPQGFSQGLYDLLILSASLLLAFSGHGKYSLGSFRGRMKSG